MGVGVGGARMWKEVTSGTHVDGIQTTDVEGPWTAALPAEQRGDSDSMSSAGQTSVRNRFIRGGLHGVVHGVHGCVSRGIGSCVWCREMPWASRTHRNTYAQQIHFSVEHMLCLTVTDTQ